MATVHAHFGGTRDDGTPKVDAPGRIVRSWFVARSEPTLALGFVLALGLAALAVVGPSLAGDAQATSPNILASPSREHLLGTDSIGRDVLARSLLGMRWSVIIAVAATVLIMVVGVAVGLVAGYAGGWLDAVTMRSVDLLLAVPAMLVAIALLAALGPDVSTLLLVLVSAYVPQVIRVSRASTMQLRGRAFVQSARISGVRPSVILGRHLLPNIRATVLVQATVTAAHMLLLEAGLSFLGLGIQPPNPSLGYMVAEGRSWMELSPLVVLAPGALMLLTVATITVVGQGLEHYLGNRA